VLDIVEDNGLRFGKESSVWSHKCMSRPWRRITTAF
jgi:hypothetical protein